MAEPMDPVQAMDDDAIDALVADWARSGQRQALQPKERTAEVIEEDRLPSALPVAELPPPEPVSWAVEGLILAGDVNLAVADGGVGKTTLAIVVAGAKTVGSSVFDHAPFRTEPAPILFVSEEDPADVIVNRLEALARGHDWHWDTVRSRFHILAQAGVSLDAIAWQTHLLNEVERIGAELVVLDPLAELTTASENSPDENKPVIRFLRRLAVETGAGVLLIHHLGKAVEGKRKIDRIRGASSFHAAARSILFLEHAEKGVRVEVVKSNRGAPPVPFVLARNIEVEGGNPAVWMRARLSYQSQREAVESAAERFVHEALKDGRRLNTSELKELAKRMPGVSAVDVSRAIRTLEERGVIDFEPGPKNAKLWGLVCLPDDSRQPGQPVVASLPTVAGQPENCPPVVASLYKRQPAGKQPTLSRQPDIEAQTYPCAECGQHRFSTPETLCFGCRRREQEAA